MIARLRCLT